MTKPGSGRTRLRTQICLSSYALDHGRNTHSAHSMPQWHNIAPNLTFRPSWADPQTTSSELFPTVLFCRHFLHHFLSPPLCLGWNSWFPDLYSQPLNMSQIILIDNETSLPCLEAMSPGPILMSTYRSCVARIASFLAMLGFITETRFTTSSREESLPAESMKSSLLHP